MTRRLIDGTDPALLVFVGWDQPLRSFFGQVYDPNLAEDDNPVHWVGAEPPWLHTVDALADAMRSYATLPLPLRAMLCAEKEAGHRQ